MFRELTPPETYAELANDDGAILVDCRSPAEWHFTGMPDLSGIGKKVVLAAVADESGRPNPQFVDEVKAVAPPNKQRLRPLPCRRQVGQCVPNSGGSRVHPTPCSPDAMFTRRHVHAHRIPTPPPSWKFTATPHI